MYFKLISTALLTTAFMAHAQAPRPVAPGSLAEAKQALAERQFAHAKLLFMAYGNSHPDSIEGPLGVADAEIGLHEYQAAELEYRRVVAQQPEMWRAHKNLVIIEAALGRWEEFDRERAVLRAARERGAEGISARESDVIDAFDVRGRYWIVREYYEPVGRSLTRYNFEQFGPDGRVREYISLESAQAARDALVQGDVLRSDEQAHQEAEKDFALDWYNGKAHGTIKSYPTGEPSYEMVRAAVMQWLRVQR